ncbi:MAG: hypothetical protein KKD39_03660 [Candidatus Altiarchaeota archaeon]|nr:hypothetical protein [Candidatus Altiarchaeota archaeon]
MAKVTAVSWIPRSYIHLFETYQGIDKTGLKIKERSFDDNKITFVFDGFETYSEIIFTQGWSGLHYFTTDLPDQDIEGASSKYMADMQKLFVEVILKNCHTVTYKQVLADIMPIDFHTIILVDTDPGLEGYKIEDAMGLKIAYKPQESYGSGEKTYVIGSDDLILLEPLMFFAYTEIVCDFLMNTMKSVIRLYHEADSAAMELQAAGTIEKMRAPLELMDKIVQETTEKSGKLKHAMMNFKLKEQEYYSTSFNETQQEIAKTLKIAQAFRRIETDGGYMSILWGQVLRKRLKQIDNNMQTVAEFMQKTRKKGWF